MRIYEVGYKNKESQEVECKFYDNLEEACYAFNYLTEKSKKIAQNFENIEIHPYIHLGDTESIFNASNYDIEKIYNI